MFQILTGLLFLGLALVAIVHTVNEIRGMSMDRALVARRKRDKVRISQDRY